MDNQKQNNSLFLYTALIFIVAIIIILLAFFAQTHFNMLRPGSTDSPQVTQAPAAGEPQGIAKSAAELSADNLELLNENRDLNKRLDLAEEEKEVYENLLAANGYMSVNNTDEASKLLSQIDYNSLSSDGKILYDQINSNIQE